MVPRKIKDHAQKTDTEDNYPPAPRYLPAVLMAVAFMWLDRIA